MKSNYIAVVSAIVIIGGAYYFVNGGSIGGQQNLVELKKENINTTNTNNMVQVTEFKIQEIVEGTGAEAKAGDSVTVDYVGSLTNGTVFDASKKHGNDGFTFSLGAGQVIKGWDLGVPGMKVGGKRKLLIPANLAYGDQEVGGGLIPANSPLIFEVELLKIGK